MTPTKKWENLHLQLFLSAFCWPRSGRQQIVRVPRLHINSPAESRGVRVTGHQLSLTLINIAKLIICVSEVSSQ